MNKNVNELRSLPLNELNEELLSLRKEQLMLRTKRAFNSLDKTHHLGMLKKSIAQVKTIISQKTEMVNDK